MSEPIKIYSTVWCPDCKRSKHFFAENRIEAGRVLRSTTTDDLQAYMAGAEPVETAWLKPARQHEEAWFLGLRLNAGVNVAAVEQEFGRAMTASALEAVERLVEAGLLVFDGKTARLTPRGQLLSNDVFQEFLDIESLTT